MYFDESGEREREESKKVLKIEAKIGPKSITNWTHTKKVVVCNLINGHEHSFFVCVTAVWLYTMGM